MTEENGRCLVVLTALRFSPEYGQAALRAAKERGEAVVLGLVVDPQLSDNVAGQLADTGFLGEKVMHDLRDTMVAEYREQGHHYLRELETEAKALGLNVETRTVEGPFLESVLRLAKETGARRIAVARIKARHLSRVFFGSEIDRLQKRSELPVEVYRLSGNVLASARA